jgi:AcrR family transcriptional regulator
MGKIERRLREKQQRMEEILQAAKRIFSEKGFSGATMRDIADSSELGRRTLYLYFKSKEELSLAVAASELQGIESRFKDIQDGPDSAYDRIIGMFDIYRALIEEDPGRFQFLLAFPEAARTIDSDNASLKECRKALAGIVQSVASMLRAGRVDRTLEYPGDPDEIAANIIFIIHSIAASSFQYRDILPSLLDLSMNTTIARSMDVVKSFLTQDLKV